MRMLLTTGKSTKTFEPKSPHLYSTPPAYSGGFSFAEEGSILSKL